MDISIPLLTSEGGVTIGKKDMGTKNLMNYPDVFADIGNVNLFCGETVLHPAELEPLPTELIGKPDGKGLVENRLDSRMRYTKGGTEIGILCAENQSDICNVMPVRDMDYLACKGDKEKLKKFRRDETRIVTHPEEFLDMLDAFAGTRNYRAVKRTLEKQKKEGEPEKMCVLYDMVFGEGLQEGRQEGRQEEAITNARMLFKNGVGFEPVAASITILPREKLVEIYEEVVDTANSGRKR